MKRILMMMCVVFLLLTGCDRGEPAASTTPSAESVQPEIPWVEELGRPRAADGALFEVPLTIPDSLPYNNSLEFDGDLLLWSQDSHLKDKTVLELCLVELDDGQLFAVPMEGSWLHLYDLEGHALSSCHLAENDSYYLKNQLWSEKLGGWFLHVVCYDHSDRLLFWDVTKPAQTEDLSLTPVPKPSEAEAALWEQYLDLYTDEPALVA